MKYIKLSGKNQPYDKKDNKGKKKRGSKSFLWRNVRSVLGVGRNSLFLIAVIMVLIWQQYIPSSSYRIGKSYIQKITCLSTRFLQQSINIYGLFTSLCKTQPPRILQNCRPGFYHSWLRKLWFQHYRLQAV